MHDVEGRLFPGNEQRKWIATGWAKFDPVGMVIACSL